MAAPIKPTFNPLLVVDHDVRIGGTDQGELVQDVKALIGKVKPEWPQEKVECKVSI